MSYWNSAKCMICEHIGNKLEMKKIKENGFVKGYVHKDCSKESMRSKDLSNAMTSNLGFNGVGSWNQY